MPSLSPSERVRFSTASIFFLGGIIGTGLSAALLAFARVKLGWHTAAAFFSGTMANLIFHHVYYHLIFVNREIKLRTPFWLQLTLYLTKQKS